MAGLFDALESDQGLLGLALLSAARAQPVRGTVSDGLLGFREMAAQRDDRKKRGLIQDLQMQEMQAQMQARQAQARAAEQAAARQLAFRQALAGGAPSGGMPMVGAQPGDGAMQMPSVSGGGPASSMPMVGGETQSLAPNWQALALQFPDQIDVLKKLAESGNFGRAEVGRVEDTMVDGRPVRQQFDKFGNPVGAALPQWKAPEKIDTGGQIGMLDPVTMRMLQQFKKTNTPDALLGAQTTMRGQNMVDARAREGNAIQQTNGRIPPGYRLRADGNLEAIPGGPADIKAGEAGAKADQRKQLAISSANSVLDTVKEAKGLVGVSTAGIGSWTAALPATDARDLSAKLETIKANLGFDRLQQMREASPTGGALGAVAVQELTALQSTVSSLDQGQSPAQLRQSLDKIERHYNRWLETVGAAAQKQSSPQSSSGRVIDFSSLPGGN